MKQNDLLEARSNPDKNVRQSAIIELSKYQGQADVFVSFTSGFDTGGKGSKAVRAAQGQHKIGLNPMSNFDTPLGIYTYPVDYVLEYSKKQGMLNAPYTGRDPWKYLYVVRRSTTNYIDSSTDIAPYFVKLQEMVVADMGEEAGNELVGEAIREARYTNNPASKFWNVARNFSSVYASKHNLRAGMVAWNVIMRKLGIDLFVDDKGTGIIHPSEPTQAVFFSAQGFRVADVISREVTRDTPPPVGGLSRNAGIEKAIKDRTINVSAINPLEFTRILNGGLDGDDLSWFASRLGAVQKRIINETVGNKWPSALMFNAVNANVLRGFGPLSEKMMLETASRHSTSVTDMAAIMGDKATTGFWTEFLRPMFQTKWLYHRTDAEVSKEFANLSGDFVNEKFVQIVLRFNSGKNVRILLEDLIQMINNNRIVLDKPTRLSIYASYGAEEAASLIRGITLTFEDWFRIIRSNGRSFADFGDAIPLNFAMPMLLREEKAFHPDPELMRRLVAEQPKFLLAWLSGPNGAGSWTMRGCDELYTFIEENIGTLAARNPVILRYYGNVKYSPELKTKIMRALTPEHIGQIVSWMVQRKWLTPVEFLTLLSRTEAADHVAARDLAHVGIGAEWPKDSEPQVIIDMQLRCMIILGVWRHVGEPHVEALFRLYPKLAQDWSGHIDAKTALHIVTTFPKARHNSNVLGQLAPADLWGMRNDHVIKALLPQANPITRLKLIAPARKENDALPELNDPTSVFYPLSRDQSDWRHWVDPTDLYGMLDHEVNDDLARILLRSFPEDMEGNIIVSQKLLAEYAENIPIPIACNKVFANKISDEIMGLAQIMATRYMTRSTNVSDAASMDITIRAVVAKFVAPPTPQFLELYADHLKPSA